MDEVAELLRTWELPDLIPKFVEQGITIQALSAMTPDDVKDIIPLIGPRVLFMRCWRTWKVEFSSTNNVSFSNLDLSNLEFGQEFTSDAKSLTDLIIVSGKEYPSEVHQEKENSQVYVQLENELTSNEKAQSGLLENILKKSLETSSLLIYKGGTLDGDATRNLLASIIAREILNEHKNSPIIGPIYFKWANYIKDLFPGERTTTYYIPACTTASGAVLQARGKLVHQVLNKRRRLQQLGALKNKGKRSKDQSPLSSARSSPRPLPDVFHKSDIIGHLENDLEDDLQWLRNSSEPWSLVETKWKNTFSNRILSLHNQDQTIESYFEEYPALKKPQGCVLLSRDFDIAYGDHTNNLFVYFPVAKIRILDLLKKKKLKDKFCEELISLANSTNEDEKNVAAFLSIPHLLNTTTVKQKNKQRKVEQSCSWKPSKVETRDAFIKHVKSDADIGHSIEFRIKTLKNKGATQQPYIIIVGESLKDIKTYLIVINESVIYQRANIMQAVDSCYKIIWALNVEYGIDSYAIWYFIQRGLYKMTSKFDKGSTSAESLLTDCNF